MKIHLGCGDVRIDGFVHVDCVDGDGIDVVCDAADLSVFQDGCVDLIYASHLLEHFPREESFRVLCEWRRVLRNGGVLRLAVPNFHALAELYLETGDIEFIMGPLYGGQKDAADFHYCGYDFHKLANMLINAGFSEVTLYDWRDTEHADVDDYSQSYYPHMDKKNGTLLSLNVEAKK